MIIKLIDSSRFKISVVATRRDNSGEFIMDNELLVISTVEELYSQIDLMIINSKTVAAKAVNNTMISLYWHMGLSLYENVLSSERAEYGDAVITEISKKLCATYGKGFSRASLFRMIQFYQRHVLHIR